MQWPLPLRDHALFSIYQKESRNNREIKMQVQASRYLTLMGQVIRNQFPRADELPGLLATAKYMIPAVVAIGIFSDLGNQALKYPETAAWAASQICAGGQVLCFALCV